MTGEQIALAAFAIGLFLGVVCTLILTPHRRRRKRDARPVTPVGERPQNVTGDLAAGRMTPAEAMAHAAPVDAPPEMERLDATAQIPQYDTIAIEPVPVAVEVWEPPEPRVVLTLTWKRPDAPLVAGRWDITNDMPDDLAPLYHAMRRQRSYDGGTITVAVKLDGRHTPDWEWQANDEWPRESIDAIHQARDQLQGVNA